MQLTSAVTFANDFDDLMQYANYKETNGIPVGAEISRVFAEIILQSVDVAIIRKASKENLTHGVHFAIRRYIDDYIIFANEMDTLDRIQRIISDALLMFNLHMNESKTFTVIRPLQTRRSQIISGASPALAKFRESVSVYETGTKALTPKSVREPQSLARIFINDIKVACINGEAGYEDVSPYIIGALAGTLESLISSYPSSKQNIKNAEAYASAIDAIITSLFYFYTVHATVTASYQIAKSAVLTIRFFGDKFPAAAHYINERMRFLMQDTVVNPSITTAAMTECVPIEMLNIILASTELPDEYRINVADIRRRILDDENCDYFSIVSMLFYFKKIDIGFIDQLEYKLRRDFLPAAQPRKKSHDSHLLLDLIACPYLSVGFRADCAKLLLLSLQISPLRYSAVMLAEMGKNPWFVNWRQIDLLNHLRKKELMAVY